MTPEQAKDWGLVDLIVEKNPNAARAPEANGSAKPAAAKEKA